MSAEPFNQTFEIPDHTLLKRIGRGSYGEVWLAKTITGQLRAIKIVQNVKSRASKEFEREFQGLQRFEPRSRTHPGFVPILHAGYGPDRKFFYYIMELADDAGGGMGSPETYRPKTLREELERRGALPLAECANIGKALAAALEQLHSQGLVHRDIKPSNILFIGQQPKLADIGLVAPHSGTSSFVGTEGYIPPDGPGTPQADIYSLGKTFYEMFTGKDRCDFPDLPATLNTADNLTAWRGFNEIMLKACATNPKRRYARVETLRKDLDAVCARLQSKASCRPALHSPKWILGGSIAALAVLALVPIWNRKSNPSLQEVVNLAKSQAVDETREATIVTPEQQTLQILQDGKTQLEAGHYEEAAQALLKAQRRGLSSKNLFMDLYQCYVGAGRVSECTRTAQWLNQQYGQDLTLDDCISLARFSKKAGMGDLNKYWLTQAEARIPKGPQLDMFLRNTPQTPQQR